MSLHTICLIATVFACVAVASFDTYVEEYGKRYVQGSDEYEKRKQIFEKNIEMINDHNADGSQSWKMGVSHMTDYTDDEVKGLNGFKRSSQPPKPEKVHSVPAGFQPPLTVDYRTAQPPVLTAVKHQACGDCWAHSATQSIESAFAKYTGNLNVLSQQQIASCTNMSSCTQDGFTGGCWGGDPKVAIQQVADFGGLQEEWTYPYTNDQFKWVNDKPVGAKCLLPDGLRHLPKPVVTTTGFTAVPMNDDAAVAHALATVGPLSIFVAATPWIHYQGGVWSMPTNASDPNYAIRFKIDHAAQLVGYGFDYDVNKHYWIVRNSWSPQWGEHGFIRVERFPGKEPCGIDTPQAVFCSNATSATVCGTSGIVSETLYANVKSNFPSRFPPQ